jgi:hypothetical protein
MKDLANRIPIELTQLLNNFNKELSEKRKSVEMAASEFRVRHNSADYDGIRLRYSLKGTLFFFEIEYLLKGDLINWKFYPESKNSTKEKKYDRTVISSVLKSNSLLGHLRLWKNNISEIEQLENPLDYFSVDSFIKFYAGEFIEEFDIGEQDEMLPLPQSKRDMVISLINIQAEFLGSEISEIDDKSSEKYNDLVVSKNILVEIQENISRMTVAEIKRNWAISLGAIRKWCENKYVEFLMADKNTKYELSRSLGSFIGGLFGIPRLVKNFYAQQK